MEGYKQPPKKDDYRIARPLLTRPAVKFGLTFILGALLGFAVFSFLDTGDPALQANPEMLKGTFYDTKSAGTIRTADVLQYNGPVASALIRTRYNSKMVEITAEFNSSQPVRCNIQFDYNNFEVLNLQNISVNDQSTALAGGNVVQLNNVGENKFVIYLANKNNLPNTIGVRLLLNDAPIFQNTIQVNRD